MNPSKSLVLLSLALAVAAPVLAGPPPDEREKRRERIMNIALGIDPFCADVEGWKISKFDPDDSAYGELAKKDLAAYKKAKAQDADMGKWKEVTRSSHRARVHQMRSQCAALKGADGLTALIAPDAPLEKIPEGNWDHLTEKLDQVLLFHSGRNSRTVVKKVMIKGATQERLEGEWTNSHYENYFNKESKTHADRIHQLAISAIEQLVEVVESGDLRKAVKAVNGR